MVILVLILMNVEKTVTVVIRTLNVQITSDRILVLVIMVTEVSSMMFIKMQCSLLSIL